MKRRPSPRTRRLGWHGSLRRRCHGADVLVASYRRPVVSIARKNEHLSPEVPPGDFLKRGDGGRHTAVQRFVPERGYRFSTSATWRIRQAVVGGIAGAAGPEGFGGR